MEIVVQIKKIKKVFRFRLGTTFPTFIKLSITISTLLKRYCVLLQS